MYRPVHLIPANTRIDFMRLHKITFAFSLLLVLGSLALIFIKGLNFGIDFEGGILMEVRTQGGPADLTSMRSQLGGLGLGEVALQEFGTPQDVLIRLQHQSYTEADRAQAAEQ